MVPGGLQFRGLKRVRYDWATKNNKQDKRSEKLILSQVNSLFLSSQWFFIRSRTVLIQWQFCCLTEASLYFVLIIYHLHYTLNFFFLEIILLSREKNLWVLKLMKWIRFSVSGPGSCASQSWNGRGPFFWAVRICAVQMWCRRPREIVYFCPLWLILLPDTAPVNLEPKNTSVLNVPSEGDKQKQSKVSSLCWCFWSLSFSPFIISHQQHQQSLFFKAPPFQKKNHYSFFPRNGRCVRCLPSQWLFTSLPESYIIFSHVQNLHWEVAQLSQHTS